MNQSLFWRAFERQSLKKSRNELEPGGWQDGLLFGYMFRVISGVVACLVPIVVLLTWGALNGWVLTTSMLVTFGAIASLLILMGEYLRSSVYDTRLRKAHPSRRQTHTGSEQILAATIEIYGDMGLYYRVVKRMFDIFFSIIALIFLSPCFIMIPLLIRFDSPGPAFFISDRVGYKGRPIRLLKFRSMTVNDNSRTEESDRHVTRVGRFLRETSMDELPQIINVLLGHLSVVGPSPPSQKNNVFTGTKILTDPHHLFLEYAKPGLTGIISNNSDVHITISHYLENRSFTFDIKIILRTFLYPFYRRGHFSRKE